MMHRHFFSAAVLSAYALRALAVPNQTPSFDASSYKQADIISKDVVIIGGGSGGTNAAISLKDKGKSVIVIEKKDRIGGHTETYIDPATGTPIDIGVQIWHNLTVVTDYFKRFDVPLIALGSDTPPNATQPQTVNYDLRTGKLVNVTSFSQAETGAAFAKYAQFLAQYPRLNDGQFLPNPVPDDLVMPFGDFAKKYGIEAVIPTMYQFNPGLGDPLTVPMIEMERVFGLSLVQQLSTGFLTTERHNNSEIYSKAQAELLSASSLLLSSTVVASKRSNENDGIKLVVRTPTGLKLICAKKLLLAIPTKLDNLTPFDLSKEEVTVFSKLIDAGYYTSIVKNTGLPDDLNVFNAAQNTSYNIPPLPAIYSIGASGVPGLHIAYYGSPRSKKSYPLSDDAVKADIIRSIKALQKSNPDKFNQTEPEFVVYSSHAPFYDMARPEDTKKGFYNDLYALQGLRNTWYTGASFRAQDSSDIWRYTEEEVLPGLLKGL
jgi:hypothetical protein